MEDQFLIVGIGASAGGIGALREFFDHVPADSGMAYVVILHLSPEYDSHLAEVLQRSTSLPVTQVTAGVRVEPGRVYVIPPNQTLSMADGHLTLSPVLRMETRRAPVDIFFRTLAEAQGARAVSVILSGTGTDGSLGIKRVKECGGFCLAQDLDEAEHPEMPRNSVATGLVDCVLPVADLPGRIAAYDETRKLVQISSANAVSAPADGALRDIFAYLRAQTGHDFSNYKRTTILRRIERRIVVHALPNLPAYAAFIQAHPDEARALLKDLLISVTNFFRDRDAFETIECVIIPKLFEGRTEEDQVRVWVPGCATGEEAYSLAMLLAARAQAPGSPAVQVFATDIDDEALATAREGWYSATDAADVPPERLNRFFWKDGTGYRVRQELRELVLFARHNVIKDPPFSHLDLVSCRNLLIYLNRLAQQRLMELFHFALHPGRYLFLGSSESIEDGDLFASVEKEGHIYHSRGIAPRRIRPAEGGIGGPGWWARPESPGPENRPAGRASYGDLHQRLLEQYAAPSIVINESYEILHMSEEAGRYLRHAGGEPSRNLLKVIRPELRLDIRAALHQASEQRSSVETHSALTEGTRHVPLDMIVRPVLRNDAGQGYFLLMFQETGEASANPPAAVQPFDQVHHLEEEVQRITALLRSTVEQHDTTTEELRASNEELQAMNEELRSSTEELETSREELQSVNEELITVNQELKIKIEEQTQATNDLQNLIDSNDVGWIFLDRASRVKLFTPRVRDNFSLIPGDRGRPLSDVSTTLIYPELAADVERVLDRLERIEREIPTRDGRWQLLRAVPYRTHEDRIEGVVLTFADITARKHGEEQLRLSEARMRLILESVRDYAIITLDSAGRIETWNPGAAEAFGYTAEEAVHRPVDVLFTPEDRSLGVPANEMRQAREEGCANDERWHLRKDGSRFFVAGTLSPLLTSAGGLTGYVKIARDLTDQKRHDEDLHRTQDQLEARVAQRTRELASANVSLEAEVHERRAGEDRVRGLLRRLVTVQEDERRRIARDLHDHLGQQMTALRLNLDSLKQRPQTDGDLHTRLESAERIATRLEADVDFLAWELRPAGIDDLGLPATLGRFLGEWSRHYGIDGEFHASGLERHRLAPDVEINLYRIAQEALNNVYKHATATRVDMILEKRDNSAVLVIEDNGKGFDPAAPVTQGADRGLGLIGMQERAALAGGTLDVESAPGKGTTLFVRIPLDGDHARS